MQERDHTNVVLLAVAGLFALPYWFIGRANLISHSQYWPGNRTNEPIAGERLLHFHAVSGLAFLVYALVGIVILLLMKRRKQALWAVVVAYYFTVSACYMAMPALI